MCGTLLALLMLASSAPAQPQAAQQFELIAIKLADAGKPPRHSLKLKLRKGATLKHVTQGETEAVQDGSTSRSTITFTTVTRILRVDKGLAKTSAASENVSLKLHDADGEYEDAEAKKDIEQEVVEATYDQFGRLASTKIIGGKPADQARADQMGGSDWGFYGALFPQTPVGIGARWSTNLDLRGITNRMPSLTNIKGALMPLNFHLERIETAGGKKIAVIRFALDSKMTASYGTRGDTFSLQMKLTGYTRARLSDGVPIKLSSEALMDIKAGPKKSTMKVKMGMTLR